MCEETVAKVGELLTVFKVFEKEESVPPPSKRKGRSQKRKAPVKRKKKSGFEASDACFVLYRQLDDGSTVSALVVDMYAIQVQQQPRPALHLSYVATKKEVQGKSHARALVDCVKKLHGQCVVSQRRELRVRKGPPPPLIRYASFSLCVHVCAGAIRARYFGDCDLFVTVANDDIARSVYTPPGHGEGRAAGAVLASPTCPVPLLACLCSGASGRP